MSITMVEIEHLSHPEHPLVLKEDDVIGVDAKCSVCNESVIGSPAYTCSSDDIGCQKFYLHKSCAELPKEIIRDKLDLHPLTLLLRVDNNTCDVCHDPVNFAYACDDCRFDVCVGCAFVSEQKVLSHEGHSKHTLTFLQRQALFKCDACWEKANDYSYVCLPCDFWIHEKCASSPAIIPAPTYHHHPLTLIFSIPVMHRYFVRYCHICKQRVPSLCWSYYCHKCTIFVHIKCSISTLVDKIEENGSIDDEPDLVQFPLSDDEAIYNLIITQCTKFQVEKSTDLSRILNDPHIIKEHWSHRDHPLELQQVTFCENENKLHVQDTDSDDDRRVLICDGCIHPIMKSHPCYYACVQCRFFLYAFCATKLPLKLLQGACPSHPQHFLERGQHIRFYGFYECGVCGYNSNGFYYKCEICDIKIEIRCAFLPTRIRHKSHKQHSLVQRPFSNSECTVSKYRISSSVEYTCETCPNFRVDILCAFYPRKLEHRYDDHSLILRNPPFFHEGVIYCQICEEQVNNQLRLYHCEGCDQSFHYSCVRYYEMIKFGGTIKHSVDNQVHTLVLVIKKTTRRNSPLYKCKICEAEHKFQYFFECEGCGYLACIYCVREKNW